MPEGPATPSNLWIANTVADLIQGDVHEHLPLEAIPLQGDVLGLGTTTSVDNGELSFLLNPSGNTTIWKCQASDGAIRELRRGDGSGHFPYVCFSSDVSSRRELVDITQLQFAPGRPLQELVAEAIALLKTQGRLPEAPIYGLRAELDWDSLIITVASKLCMGQQRRNVAVASSETSDALADRSIYQLLQHYRLAPVDPGRLGDPIRYLGASLQWDCCGFYDTTPELGRVTVPQAGAHLHLHGCSQDLRFGGHLHHEHSDTRLAGIRRLVLYPLENLMVLASDLAIEEMRFDQGLLRFQVVNCGSMDVSDVGVAVVVDDCYSSHHYLRLPWLKAGAGERFTLPLSLPEGTHRVEVIADPQAQILESTAQQGNNRSVLLVDI